MTSTTCRCECSTFKASMAHLAVSTTSTVGEATLTLALFSIYALLSGSGPRS